MSAGRGFMVGRRTALRVPGGDALHELEAAERLRAAGFDVVLEERADRVRPAAGDSVHVWNIQRCLDWGDLPERARAAGARLLLTPLFHSLQRYHQEGRFGVDALAARLVPDADRFAALRWGRADVKRRARVLLDRADRVLLVHEGEAPLLRDWCGAELPEPKLRVVPVAVPAMSGPDAQGAAPGPPPPRAGSPFGPGVPFVLSVGRVEPLKNPLAVLAACRELELPVAFVGEPSATRHALHSARFFRDLAAAGPSRAQHLGALPYAQVRALMHAARMHVLASWTEVVGRATLEAALLGCAVALSDAGWAKEYLGRGTEGVFVFDPGDDDALRGAVQAAWRRGRDEVGAPVRRVREGYTWDVVGPRLVDAWAP
jgi:glycosyltransferase involved in cell wall biosynthesis